MRNSVFLIFLFLFFFLPNQSHAGIFTMSDASPTPQTNEIPIDDKLDKVIQKRQKEARKLILEGRKLIKKGEKKKNEDLIIKGQIKKQIGEKQLEALKEQEENKKRERENDIW
ncbi:MAG: hypothetical protein A3B68_06135 [Candidatus Melainabacteria bacterium RIFCSPHIGHO2_02_FULL_34_12]|nr:MAG: hypothetical protein A3B68_06135 [Candidatus Melainabacteria bacterium RIFCSPHIGHO2_02_FULL_34_12]